MNTALLPLHAGWLHHLILMMELYFQFFDEHYVLCPLHPTSECNLFVTVTATWNQDSQKVRLSGSQDFVRTSSPFAAQKSAQTVSKTSDRVRGAFNMEATRWIQLLE